MMVKDADTIVVTELTNTVSLPIGVDYTACAQSGQDVKALILERADEVQMYLQCLQTESKCDDCIVLNPKEPTSVSPCQTCLELDSVCPQCSEAGHEHVEPQLTACNQCLSKKVL